MEDRDFNIAIDLANYILDDRKEERDFYENPSSNHIYLKAMYLIYDYDQMRHIIKVEYGLEHFKAFNEFFS